MRADGSLLGRSGSETVYWMLASHTDNDFMLCPHLHRAGRRAGVLISLSLIFFAAPPAWAQDCHPASIHLTRQQHVDQFQADHGPCNRISSQLIIRGFDISNLRGLSALTAIGGDLFIEDTDKMTDLSGLSSLKTIGGEVGVFHNFGLLSIDGLESLTRVSGDLAIFANPEMLHVDGLSSLTSVGGFLALSDLESLVEVDGLISLTLVEHHLYIKVNHHLENLHGLSSLVKVGGVLNLELNDVLISLDGLDSLTSIGIDLDLYANNALQHLDGLEALIEVGRNVVIQHHPSLSGCMALASLLDEKDDAIAGPGGAGTKVPDVGGFIALSANLFGCNDRREILARHALRARACARPLWSSSVLNPGCRPH